MMSIRPREADIRTFLSATRLASHWERLRASFWFLPSMMASLAVLLSYVLVRVDAWIGVETVREFGWLYTFGAEGARAILSAIASSMITVAGLTFSITMLTLQLASSQFGPRLLRNFMRDRGNQLVLGTYIATFIYCLLVLRTVRGTEDSHFVPHLAVAVGVVFALASIAVLIYFIHHVATAIRIETLLAQLAAEAQAAVDRLYPERIGDDPPADTRHDREPAVPQDFAKKARPIPSGRSGYVQRVDEDALMKLAVQHDLVVRIEARPGRFVWRHDVLLSVFPRDAVTEEAAAALRAALVLGADRTPEQDLEFSIRRIVEIAQRALSPGINDPTTALYCIDRLGETFGRLAERAIPSPLRVDGAGRVRVLTESDSLQGLVCPAFAAIARYGIADADVAARLLGTLDRLRQPAPPAARAATAELREELCREAQKQAQLGCDRKSLAPP